MSDPIQRRYFVVESNPLCVIHDRENKDSWTCHNRQQANQLCREANAQDRKNQQAVAFAMASIPTLTPTPATPQPEMVSVAVFDADRLALMEKCDAILYKCRELQVENNLLRKEEEEQHASLIAARAERDVLQNQVHLMTVRRLETAAFADLLAELVGRSECSEKVTVLDAIGQNGSISRVVICRVSDKS